MADIDDELDAFLNSDSENEAPVENNDSDFDDIELPDLDDESPTKTSSDDEDAALQAQIAALQQRLKNKKKRKALDSPTSSQNSQPSPCKILKPSQSPNRKRSALGKSTVVKAEPQTPENSQNGQSKQSTVQKSPPIVVPVAKRHTLTVQVTKSRAQKLEEKTKKETIDGTQHTETFSRLKYIGQVTNDADKQLAGRKFVPFHQIQNGGKIKSESWFTVVVVVTSMTKTSQKGESFGLLKVSNLYNCPHTGALFLFGGAKTSLHPLLSDGCLIAVLAPKILPARQSQDEQAAKTSQNNLAALSVSSRDEIIIFGKRCQDFGYCHGQQFITTSEGKVQKQKSGCRNFVNISLNPFCSYHLARSSTSKRGIFNSTAKPLTKSDQVKRTQKQPKIIERTYQNIDTGEEFKVDAKHVKCASNPQNAVKNLKIEKLGRNIKIEGGTKTFNQALNRVTPGALVFKAHMKQKSDSVDLGKKNSINRVEHGKVQTAFNAPVHKLSGAGMRELAKKHSLQKEAAAKLKKEAAMREQALKNEKIAAIMKRVNASKKCTDTKKEVKSSGKRVSKDLLEAKSKFAGSQTKEESRAQDLYFSVLEKRDEKLLQELATTRAESKVVTCKDCKYTYWSPHDNCRKKGHTLTWNNVIKRFFDCACGQGRAVTWKPFPKVCCSACGNTTWRKGGATKVSSRVKLDTEKLELTGGEPLYLK